MDGILYFECSSGISGDMAVAAMLDLGADAGRIGRALGSTGLKGYRMEITDVIKSGMRAKDFAVILDRDNHDHDPGYLYGDRGAEEQGHGHTTYPEIVAVIESADMSPRARGYAHRILAILAEAEAEAHGVPMADVHFHEVGAVDSIVDIIALAVCLDDLDVDGVCFSDLYEGTGTVRCQHGIIPVPAPAVANIVRAHGLKLRITGSAGEYVTPTGAAFAAASRTCSVPRSFIIDAVGIGAGKRESERTGILRAMILDPSKEDEEVVKLECNIDDSTGESLGFAMDQLFAAGAREVNYSPVFMKKNRPGWLLTVICKEEEREALERAIFRETSTIGIRRCVMERTKLERGSVTVSTGYGDVSVKVVSAEGTKRFHPEYEDVARISRENGVPFRDVYDAAVSACRGLRVQLAYSERQNL